MNDPDAARYPPARVRTPEPARPFVLDVEASALGPAGYPIEIGVALAAGERQSLLVRPAPSWTHWDDAAERVHGISREILLAHGRPITEVAVTLNARLAGRVLYSDGWVVDRPWLTMLFHEARVPMTFELRPLEAILSESRMAVWDEAKRAVVAELAVARHRASHDAWIAQETFLRARRLARTDAATASGTAT